MARLSGLPEPSHGTSASSQTSMRVGTLYAEICSRARRGDVVGVDGAALRGHEHRGHLLAELRMRHAEHERVEHLVEVLLEEQLDLAGRDVGAARLHHLGVATDEVRPTAVQEHAVAGVEPAVVVEHLGALLLVVPVHQPVAADPQLALLAVGNVAPVSGSTTR